MERSPIIPPPDARPPDHLPAGWHGSNAAPLEIDIGCHKGLFLVEMARLYPERNFFGIERQTERVERARKKIRAQALANAVVVRGDGFEVLRDLPEKCAAGIHVLFPDPWPKRRHQARRLVQAGFFKEAGRALKPEGFLRLVTDDADYAAAMKDEAPNFGFMATSDGERVYPLTEFQKKFLADGRPVYSLRLVFGAPQRAGASSR